MASSRYSLPGPLSTYFARRTTLRVKTTGNGSQRANNKSLPMRTLTRRRRCDPVGCLGLSFRRREPRFDRARVCNRLSQFLSPHPAPPNQDPPNYFRLFDLSRTPNVRWTNRVDDRGV